LSLSPRLQEKLGAKSFDRQFIGKKTAAKDPTDDARARIVSFAIDPLSRRFLEQMDLVLSNDTGPFICCALNRPP